MGVKAKPRRLNIAMWKAVDTEIGQLTAATDAVVIAAACDRR
jgi:hypothetical protein